MTIKKNEWRYAVDTLLFLCVVGMVLVGIIIGILIPEGPATQGGDKYFWSLHRHQWGKIHLYLSFTFAALLIIHLVLSWKWITAQAKHLFKKRWVIVLIMTFLLSLFIVFLFWQFTPKNSEKYSSYGKGRGGLGWGVPVAEKVHPSSPADFSSETETIEITGQMTLEDIERRTGIPYETILKHLGLSEQIGSENSIGRLRNAYGFSMEDVRNVISRLLEENPPENIESSSVEAPKEMTDEGEHTHSEDSIRGRLSENPNSILIVGRMTFKEIETQTGIPAKQILQALGLPETLSVDETLGRLRKQYGFTLQKVREIVSALMKIE